MKEILTHNQTYCEEIINKAIKQGSYVIITERQAHTCGSSPIKRQIEKADFNFTAYNTASHDLCRLILEESSGNKVLEYVPKKSITIQSGIREVKHLLSISEELSDRLQITMKEE